MTELKRKPILVAIDHGYGNVKTPNFIFPTGITAYGDEPAMATDTLRWAGRWYAIGDTHRTKMPGLATTEEKKMKRANTVNIMKSMDGAY